MEGFDYLESLPKWSGTEKFDLTVVESLVGELGMPQDSACSIHVAGTNGKGSTSVCIAAMCGASGRRTGLNTSPHLERLSERFVIDGQEVSKETISQALLEIRRAAVSAKVTPSFHEAVTAAAFILFRNLDWAIYEVGLGGRLDASNVLTAPKVSVITSIGLDHQKILGYSIEEIAAEKAGIIKPNTQVVVGKMSKAAMLVIDQIAQAHRVPVRHFAADFEVSLNSNQGFIYQDKSTQFEFQTGLQGSYQLSNLGCAIQAALLSGVSVDACKAGLANVFWPGRMEEVVHPHKKILLDCAHNIDGIRVLIENTNQTRDNQLLLFGLLQRPDWQDILSEVAASWKNIIVLTPPTERALPGLELEAFLSCNNINVLNFDRDYSAALEAALNGSHKEIIISGSIYLVGAIRSLLNPVKRPLWKMQKIS